ncbi:hypothetical protein AB4124_18305 [Paenibacillus sp. 2KB_20]|uniref:hypothetical protein n=1 Tax=Paenibacillus sp. 2KB_20 TaxID=3232977 RepID=UPI003F98BE0A
MRQKLLVIAVLTIVFIVSVSIYSLCTSALTEEEFVAEVNGSPVTVMEFKRELERHRASVIDYFHRTYGADYSKDFWKTDFDGEKPVAILKQRALEELAKVKVELELAKSKGLIRGTGYDDLMQEMDKENKRRLAAVKSHIPVYGPVQLDENTFMSYYLSNLRNELKDKLAENELKPTDKKLQQHYEMVKDEILIDEDIVRFEKISVSYKDGSSDTTREQKQTAANLMESAQLLLEQGMEMFEAAKVLQISHEGSLIRYTEAELNDKTASTYFKSQPVLYSLLQGDLKTGKISTVIDEPVQGEYGLVRITGREARDYKSYEENRELVLNSYIDTAYTEFIHRLTADAQVKVMDNQYYHIEL